MDNKLAVNAPDVEEKKKTPGVTRKDKKRYLDIIFENNGYTLLSVCKYVSKLKKEKIG